MSNINVGTIFALEANLPTFHEVKSISSQSSREKRNSLRNWKIFSNLKEDDEILGYLVQKEHELLEDASSLVENDEFFSTLLWLRHNMVNIRKLFRVTMKIENNETASKHFETGAREIAGYDDEFAEVLTKTYSKLPRNLSVFELERKLDELYFRLLKQKAGRNKIKKEYANLFANTYKTSAKTRTEYLNADGIVDEKSIDSSGKEFSEKEIDYANQSVINMDENLVMLSYLTKIKYLMYDLQIAFADFDKDKEDLLINYSFS